MARSSVLRRLGASSCAGIVSRTTVLGDDRLTLSTADIDQFVLLAVDIVCTEQGTPVPWDCVAEKLNEYVSGEGIKQHLAKVRKYREQNGRRVPHKSAHKSGRVGGRKVSMQDTDFHQRTPKKKGRDDRLAPATGKGASLLWTDPRAKVPRQPKEVGEDAGETEKQKSKEGRKKAANTENTVEVSKTPPKKSRPSTGKAEEFEGNNNIKKTKSTGRRGRTKRDLVIKDEDEAECLGTGSPIKRERNLRTTYAVNYDETQMLGELDEDIFDAQNYDDVDGDEGYDEPTHGFQSAAVRKSANGKVNSTSILVNGSLIDHSSLSHLVRRYVHARAATVQLRHHVALAHRHACVQSRDR